MLKANGYRGEAVILYLSDVKNNDGRTKQYKN